MKRFFDGYPSTAHPMAILSAMVASLSSYYPDALDVDNREIVDITIARLLAKVVRTIAAFSYKSRIGQPFVYPEELAVVLRVLRTTRTRRSCAPSRGRAIVMSTISRLLAKVRTIAAFSYKKSTGQPFVYPKNSLSYCANFLNMMFSVPAEPYEMDDEVVKTLNLLLILHADHEQNCSTSTVRLVGSSKANLFASIAAGICALWGPLHGGANQEVVEMLESIRKDGGDVAKYVALAKVKDLRASGSWSSATASTSTTTRARASSRWPPTRCSPGAA